MSTKTPNPQERTATSDPRPSRIYLGRDAHGAEHHYLTTTETVVVVDAAGRRQRRQDVSGDHIESWMVYVAERRGWQNANLYADAASALAGQIERVER